MTGEIGILNVGCGDTKEPHDYPDGTTEFTHVRYRHKPEWGKGAPMAQIALSRG